MSISGISSGMASLSQLSQIGSQTTSISKDSDGDNDSRGAGRVSRKGGIASAISQALSQLGISGASAQSGAAPTGATSAQDPQQAIRAFMHDLFAALRSQGSGATAPATNGSDGDNSGATGVANATSHKYGANGIESKLQNLISQLSSASSSTSGSSSSNSALAPLQQDFQNMLSALGATGSQATLGSFLQSFSQNLQGANPAGNLVSTRA